MRHRGKSTRSARPVLFSAALFSLYLLLPGCRSLRPEGFSGAEPRFEPDRYFEGSTRSWGALEGRSGKPKSRFRTDMTGHRDERGDLVITQDFTFEDGHTQQRIWHIHRVDDHRYETTAKDVIGTGIGEAFGNVFHWEYTLELHPGHRLSRVHMAHWMYLQADGQTMINRVTISKLGFVLAQTTEHFHRGTGPVPSISRTP